MSVNQGHIGYYTQEKLLFLGSIVRGLFSIVTHNIVFATCCIVASEREMHACGSVFEPLVPFPPLPLLLLFVAAHATSSAIGVEHLICVMTLCLSPTHWLRTK